jgi:hypothetical protein
MAGMDGWEQIADDALNCELDHARAETPQPVGEPA